MLRKLLIIDLVGLTPNTLQHMPKLSDLFSRGTQSHLTPPLPAVTCTSQATITTGSPPSQHGIVSNGWYFRDTAEVRFWLRSDRLVGGEAIWQTLKRLDPNASCTNVFWRFCTHADCDITLTERPTYWANGRKGPDVYASPGTLRNELVERLGEFPLFRFWGPATNISATEWIANATEHLIKQNTSDLTLTYLPHLDYDLQKFGPSDARSIAAMKEVDDVTAKLVVAAQANGHHVAVLSEYGITEVSRSVYLNRVLRREGYLAVEHAKNGELLEPGASRAFAACSHQVAHVYVRDAEDLSRIKEILQAVDGVDQVLGKNELADQGLDHARSGEFVVVAEPDAWFAYPYWLDDANAPDFARCVAIHDKPGHDPMEMFLGDGGKGRVIRRLIQNKLGLRAPMDVISLDATRIRGSHGRLPDSAADGPMMLTSWDHDASSLDMTDLKQMFIDRMQSE